MSGKDLQMKHAAEEKQKQKQKQTKNKLEINLKKNKLFKSCQTKCGYVKTFRMKFATGSHKLEGKKFKSSPVKSFKIMSATENQKLEIIECVQVRSNQVKFATRNHKHEIKEEMFKSSEVKRDQVKIFWKKSATGNYKLKIKDYIQVRSSQITSRSSG